MSNSAQVHQAESALSYAAIGFGALSLATPRLFLMLYGLRGDDVLRVFVRLWGVRNLALGVNGLRAEDPAERRKHLAMTAGVSAGDVVAIATAGKEVPLGSRVLGALTAAGFLAAAAYALSQDD